MARDRKPDGRKLPEKGNPIQDRPVGTREKPLRFLIVCEGKETETNYFKSFRANINVETLDVVGTGFNTDTLVEETNRLKKQAIKERKPYTQVWAVFDRDDFLSEHFNNAIQNARQAGIRVAYSNEAFELWYLLHFAYMDNALERDQYEPKLSEYLGKRYKKNDPAMYHTLGPKKQAFAIQNAQKLLKSYHPNHNPEKDNPCTTVHELVIELNKHLV